MSWTQRLGELGIELPAVATPVAAYVPAILTGRQVVTSGQLPMVAGQLTLTGLVGYQVTPEQATEAARVAVLNAISAAAAAAGGIDRIQRILKLVVYVASVSTFTGQAQIANGASEVVHEIFGEAGQHARSAVGVAVLPLGSPVEIELTAELAD